MKENEPLRWSPPEENQDLKSLIRQALLRFKDVSNPHMEVGLMTSIRGGIIWVEVIIEGEVLWCRSRDMDEVSDDVEVEREFLEEIITDMIVEGIEERWKVMEIK